MENISYLESPAFYDFLKALIVDRINELRESVRTYEYIERDRGLFYHEKRAKNQAFEALTINEDFMLFFDPTYTKFQ